MPQINWMKYYGLTGDPFTTSPIIAFGHSTLFFKTNAVSSQIDPFIEYFSNSPPSIKSIVGERGLGKTTILRYIETKCNERDVFTIFVRSSESVSKNFNQNSVMESLIIGTITEILTKLKNDYVKIFDNYRDFLNKIIETVGFQLIGNKIFTLTDNKNRYELKNLIIITRELLKIIKDENFKTILLIDNLDKYDTEENVKVLLSILKDSISQTFLESFIEHNGSVCISFSTNLFSKMVADKNKDFSYLEDSIKLNRLLPSEAGAILKQRFKLLSKQDAPFPLDEQVVLELVENEKGITRQIIIAVKNLLIKSAEKEIQLIDIKSYQAELEKSVDDYTFYNNFVSDYDFKKGLLKLSILQSFLTYDDLMKTLEIFEKLFNNLRLEDDEKTKLIPLETHSEKFVLKDFENKIK